MNRFTVHSRQRRLARLIPCFIITFAIPTLSWSARPDEKEANAQAANGLQVATDAIPNSLVKFDMMRLPGGPFTMADPTQPGKTITADIKPFWIETTETKWD